MLAYCCSRGLLLASVVGQAHCCSVVTVNNKNTVQLLTFGNSRSWGVVPRLRATSPETAFWNVDLPWHKTATPALPLFLGYLIPDGSLLAAMTSADRLVANALGMQTFTFRAYRALKLCMHCRARTSGPGPGPADWVVWDGLGSGIAIAGPFRTVTAAWGGLEQPLRGGLARGRTGV